MLQHDATLTSWCSGELLCEIGTSDFLYSGAEFNTFWTSLDLRFSSVPELDEEQINLENRIDYNYRRKAMNFFDDVNKFK